MKTVKDIVTEFLYAQGKNSRHDFGRVLQSALRGLKDLHYDVTAEPVNKYVEMGPSNTVPIPEDMINMIGAFFVGEDDKLIPIIENRQLAPRKEQCGELSRPAQQSFDFIDFNAYPQTYFSQHFESGEIIGAFYYKQGGTEHFYNINKQNGVIEFTDNVAGEILIQYIANISRTNGDFVVHPFVEDALLKWIYYDHYKFRNNVSIGEKQVRRKEYYDAKYHSIRQFQSISIQEAFDSSRKGKQNSPKL